MSPSLQDKAKRGLWFLPVSRDAGWVTAPADSMVLQPFVASALAECKDLTQQWLLSSQAMMDGRDPSPNPLSSDGKGAQDTLLFSFPVQRSPAKT